jgi:hypothetical protein
MNGIYIMYLNVVEFIDTMKCTSDLTIQCFMQFMFFDFC